MVWVGLFGWFVWLVWWFHYRFVISTSRKLPTMDKGKALNYKKGMPRNDGSTKFVCMRTLIELGVLDGVVQLFLNIGWENILNLTANTYELLTCVFRPTQREKKWCIPSYRRIVCDQSWEGEWNYGFTIGKHPFDLQQTSHWVQSWNLLDRNHHPNLFLCHSRQGNLHHSSMPPHCPPSPRLYYFFLKRSRPNQQELTLFPMMHD